MSPFSALEPAPDLLRRAQSGDNAAYEVLYRSCYPAVHGLTRRLVVRPAAAEDVAQDVFVEVLRNLRSYTGEGPFGAWLRAVTVSKCLMHLRSPWQRASAWAHGSSEDWLDEWVSDPAVDPTAAAGERALERALAALPPLARAVVWLHDVLGYTHAEIGREFGRTASFSKSQLARAHERLRAQLTDSEVAVCTPASTSC